MHNENILYRFYGPENTLLYVGITNNWPSRLKDHSRRAVWYSSVENIKLERFETREKLEDAEIEAIKLEKPKYNVRSNPHSTPLKHYRDLVEMIEKKDVDTQHKDLAWWMVDFFREEMLFISQYLPVKVQNHRKIWAQAFLEQLPFLEDVFHFSCDLCSKVATYPTIDSWSYQVQNAVQHAYEFFDEDDESKEPFKYGLSKKFADLDLEYYEMAAEERGWTSG